MSAKQPIESVRKAAYKANNLTLEESRLRRHEVTVELRKNKREDQLLKRRNIKEEDLVTSPLKESNGQSVQSQMSIEEIVAAMNSDDLERQFAGMQAARKMLSRERNPPIDTMIAAGVVPRSIHFLQMDHNPMIQFEAAWALTNIASGNSEQTRVVIEQNAIPHFVRLLRSKNLNIAEQAVWALGNIAGDGAIARDSVIKHRAIDGLLPLINDDTPLSFLRNIVWLMSNLCRNKNPPPPFEEVKRMLPVLSHLLQIDDPQVIADVCWALSYVTDDENTKIQAVVDVDAVPCVVKMLNCDDPTIIVPALRTVGNIVTGNDIQTDTVIQAGGLAVLSRLLKNPKANIVKEAAWTVSNIAAGNFMQVQALVESGIFNEIRAVLESGDFKSQKEAAWVVTNTTSSGRQEQVIALVDKFGILKPFLDLLDAKDARTVRVVLTGLTNFLQFAERLNNLDRFCLMIEEIGALDKLEALQQHENEEIYKKAYGLISAYFENEEKEECAPTQSENQFNFGANSNPPGGFNF